MSLEKPSAQEDFSKSYSRLMDIPSDVLGSRMVKTLIEAKGDLNKYKLAITHFIEQIREEYTPAPASLADELYEAHIKLEAFWTEDDHESITPGYRHAIDLAKAVITKVKEAKDAARKQN